MNDFVKQRGGRPGSSASSAGGGERPFSLNRGAAASLKVHTNNRLSHDDQSQQRPRQQRQRVQGQSTSQPMQLQQNHQQPIQHLKGVGTKQKRDAYDTDAESLNTTLPSASIVQVEDSQQPRQGLKREGDEEEDAEGKQDAEDKDNETEVEFVNFTREQWRLLDDANMAGKDVDVQMDWLEKQQHLTGGGLDYTLYPDTTSGVPSNFTDFHYHEEGVHGGYDASGEEAPSDQAHDASPSPQHPRTREPHSQLHFQPLQLRPSTPQDPPSMQKPGMHAKAAALRTQRVPNANAASTQFSFQQGLLNNLPNSQPLSYSQDTKAHQLDHVQPNTAFPPRGVIRQTSGPARRQEAQITQLVQPVQPMHFIQNMSNGTSLGSTVRNHSGPARNLESNEVRAASPIPAIDFSPPEHNRTYSPDPAGQEDYDRPALFHMPYEQLQDEDFDVVPRGLSRPVLPHMEHQSLADRLQHVQSGFNQKDQSQFFTALSTAEWEEAGDWFLDRFGDVVTRMREARQNKRKLAKDFEAEVLKRHRRVAEQQRNVEDALQKMKLQGQGLVPKTPKKERKTPRKGH